MLVEQCSCSAVHVTIGAVTLRLEARAIASLALTLQEAALGLVGGEMQRASAAARRASRAGGSGGAGRAGGAGGAGGAGRAADAANDDVACPLADDEVLS